MQPKQFSFLKAIIASSPWLNPSLVQQSKVNELKKLLCGVWCIVVEVSDCFMIFVSGGSYDSLSNVILFAELVD